MRFYTNAHAFYCGIDLHARSVYVCIIDHQGEVRLHRNMKAIHGGKAKNDRIDSRKIAALIRGGTFPTAYVYPAEMRATRDLLRRRNHLTRKRAELISHVQNTNSQYNLRPFEHKITYAANRDNVIERFTDPDVRMSVTVDLDLIAQLDDVKKKLELHILRNARRHDPQALYLLDAPAHRTSLQPPAKLPLP